MLFPTMQTMQMERDYTQEIFAAHDRAAHAHPVVRQLSYTQHADARGMPAAMFHGARVIVASRKRH